MSTTGENSRSIPIERVQIGVRLEQRMVKVLKALAEYVDLSLGDLLEGIVLHAFEGKAPFSEETVRRIAQLKDIYGMNYGVEASHRMREPLTNSEADKDNRIGGADA